MNDQELIDWLKENSSGVYRPALEAAERMQEMISLMGQIDGIIFGVSCDGGKTAVAWRRNVFKALEYLELQNKNGITKYSVVAIKADKFIKEF